MIVKLLEDNVDKSVQFDRNGGDSCSDSLVEAGVFCITPTLVVTLL